MKETSRQTSADPSARPPILAGGGVLWRHDAAGAPEVAVVHRPRYDDWSLPKGKMDASDRDLRSCAIREVGEETGQRVDVGAVLGEARYRSTAKGGAPADKIVRYWLLEAVAGEFVPNREIDDLLWLPPGKALDLLSYEHERVVLRRALRRLPSPRSGEDTEAVAHQIGDLGPAAHVRSLRAAGGEEEEVDR